MNKTLTRNYVIEIPLHWTAAQANAVFDFICILETAVFGAYDAELTETARHHILDPPIDCITRDDDGNDIPF
jgi:hypothetical protein